MTATDDVREQASHISQQKLLKEGPVVTCMFHMAYLYEHILFGTGSISRLCINARVHVHSLVSLQ